MVRYRIEQGKKTTSQQSCGYLGDFPLILLVLYIAYAIDGAESIN